MIVLPNINIRSPNFDKGTCPTSTYDHLANFDKGTCLFPVPPETASAAELCGRGDRLNMDHLTSNRHSVGIIDSQESKFSGCE